jgi:hypothetical protein
MYFPVNIEIYKPAKDGTVHSTYLPAFCMCICERGRGLLSLMSTIEELPEKKKTGSGLGTENTAVGIHHADHVTPSICKSWHYLR